MPIKMILDPHLARQFINIMGVVVAKKTKEELWEELNIARANAKARYDNVVKPVQEAYRLAEQKERIILEQTIGRASEPKDYNCPYLVKPIQSELIHEWDISKRKRRLYLNNSLDFQKLLDMPREVSPETHEFLEPYIIESAIQNNINAAKDTYGKFIATGMSDYKIIEKSARRELKAAIILADKQYDENIKELRKVDDWFEFRRTYQRLCTHEEIKAMKATPECNVDIACIGTRSQQSTATRLKCHFCGDSKVRTEAGMNKVKYRLKHPNAGFWSRLFGRDWTYACHDCMNYMIHLWGLIKYEVIDGNMCSVCNGSGRLPWVLPYLSRACTNCNGSGKV